MRHRFFLRATFGLCTLLCVLPITAQAKFLIEFTDGHNMTVANYEERGDTIKVYTSLGSFAFQKQDITKITNLNTEKKTKKPTATAKARPFSSSPPEKEPEVLALEKRPDPSPQKEQHTSSPLENIASQVEDGLFRMRYVFALAAGLKALKIFFAASTK
jgi:hypothetical protein